MRLLIALVLAVRVGGQEVALGGPAQGLRVGGEAGEGEAEGGEKGACPDFALDSARGIPAAMDRSPPDRPRSCEGGNRRPRRAHGGYANQGDMHRTSAVHGALPHRRESRAGPHARGAPPRASRSARAPKAATRAPRSSSRRRRWRSIAPRAAIREIQAELGRVREASRCSSASRWAFAWLLRDHGAAGALHGLIVLLVLSDPVVTLWMNTLYTDFAVIWSLYVVTLACCVLALYDRQSYLSWALAHRWARHARDSPASSSRSCPWPWCSPHGRGSGSAPRA